MTQPSADASPAPRTRRAIPWSDPLGLALLLIGMSVASWSVVRYDLRIVLAYAALTGVLALALVLRRSGGPRHAATAAAAVAATAVTATQVHTFTYLEGGDARRVHLALAVTALLAAVLLVLPRSWAPDVALGVAVLGFVGVAAALIHLDPAPKIDVWVMLNQAADGLLRGENMYTQNWQNSPGVQSAFTYLPWMGVLLAPGRWLAGDVRWALVVLTVVAALLVRALPGAAPARGRAVAAGLAALLLLLPGTSTQVEQGWTEPLLLACVAGAALALTRGRFAVAVALIALGLAGKQHLALLLPLLAVWPRFGWRRTAATAGVAGLLVLPWFLADPRAMFDDTVALLVRFPPLKFADTLYIAALRELSWTPPFWVTGAIVLGTVAGVAVLVRRRNPDVGEFLRWGALVLLVANLVNKQAFYNQYWLVAALVLLSWAVPAASSRAEGHHEAEAEATDPAPNAEGDPSAQSAPSAAK